MQGWNSSIKIKGLQCLFNRIFCLEAVSWTEVDAINVEGQIQSSIFIEDWSDAADSPTNDQLISPSPSPLPLQLATLDSAFMAVFTRPCEESHFLPVVDRERSWSRNRGFHGRSWRNCDVTFWILQTVRSSSVTFLLNPWQSDLVITSTEICWGGIMSPPLVSRGHWKNSKNGIQTGNMSSGILMFTFFLAAHFSIVGYKHNIYGFIIIQK